MRRRGGAARSRRTHLAAAGGGPATGLLLVHDGTRGALNLDVLHLQHVQRQRAPGDARVKAALAVAEVEDGDVPDSAVIAGHRVHADALKTCGRLREGRQVSAVQASGAESARRGPAAVIGP